MVMHLDEEAVRAVLHWDPLIDEMEAALAAFSSNRVIQPMRNMITIEEGRRYLGIMPAVAAEAMGLKLVSFYPGNAGTSVPTHLAMILLFRPDTGEPLAVMDGRLITEMRTAAVSAAVTRRLPRPTAVFSRCSAAASRPRRISRPCPGFANSMTFACGAGRRSMPFASRENTARPQRTPRRPYEAQTSSSPRRMPEIRS